MGLALDEARAALVEKETPVGAIVMMGNDVIGRGHNRCEASGDPTQHAEMLALREAMAAVGNSALNEATMFVTLEPCPMCAGAIVLAMIKRLVFGAFDPKMGAAGTLYDIVEDDRLNHRVEVISGIRADESVGLLREFFRSLRK